MKLNSAFLFFVITSMVSSPENTKDPLSMEYRMTPTEKTSTLESYL
jgi:hypothetical protein